MFFFLFFNQIACSTEQQLIRKLLQYYEPSVRPVLQAQAVVTVSFRMEITQLFELVRISKKRFVQIFYSFFVFFDFIRKKKHKY